MAPSDELVVHRRFARIAALFPTGRTHRIRFMFEDARTGTQWPGWVVREHHYAFGLDSWFAANEKAAKVTSAKDILGSDYVVQVMVSTNDAEGSRPPIFIPLPKDLANPTRYVIQNVLGIIALACQHVPVLREAFTEKSVKEAQARPIEEVIDDRFLPLGGD